MHRGTHRLLSCALVMVSLVGGHRADAATFTGLSQARSVAIAGILELTDFETGDTFKASAAPSAQTAPGDFGLFDRSVGLGQLVLDNPLGNGRGSGRASQTSTLGTEAIHFDGTADVFMSGEVNGNAEMTGSGSAASRFVHRFSLSQATTVRLDMVSELGPRNNDYTFALTHENGEVVWDQTSVFDDDGNVHRTFLQTLALMAGVYDLNVALTATSFFTANFGFAGRALATFSITPVPLGNPLALLVRSCAVLGRIRRQRRGAQ